MAQHGLDNQMKKILEYTLANLISISFVTLIVGIICFILFWLFIGAISFVAWTLPAVWPDIWLVTRACLTIGFIISLFFVLSKEGRSAADDFVKDEYKL